MLTTNQFAASTAPTVFATVPAGPCIVVLSSDPASTGTAYIGAGTATVTTSNGVPLGVGASITFAGYKGSAGVSLSAVCASGKTAAIGMVISTGM